MAPSGRDRFGVAATNWATTSAVTLTLSDPATSFAGEFATWAEDDTFGPSSATKVTVEGLNSLYQSVGSETLYLEPNFQWLNVAFTSQAAYIWILNDGSGEWLMDVPEPASYALLCTALSSLLVLRRRQASPLV